MTDIFNFTPQSTNITENAYPGKASVVSSTKTALDNYAASDVDNTPKDFLNKLVSFDYNYDYAAHPNEVVQDTSMWEEISKPVEATGAFLWDTAQGTWKSVKEGAASIGESAANLVDSAGNKIGGAYDWVLTRMVIIFAVLVGGLFLLGRAGVISDIAKVFVVK